MIPKSRLRRIAASGFTTRLCAPLVRRRATIFTLHRFAVPDLGIPGHDPLVLRQVLARFRRDRYELVTVADAMRRLRESPETARRLVVFTIDDGYEDVALAGAEAFLAFDCPVTVFLTTGFVDASLWLWWDKIEYVCRYSRSTRIALPDQAGITELVLQGPRQRQLQARQLFQYCKQITDVDKHRFIDALALRAEVELPPVAPVEYRALTWQHVAQLEARGVTFGPHSVSHPILSLTDDGQAAREIGGSWRVLQTRVRDPLPVFAYPNGTPGDYGVREVALLRACGLEGALTTVPSYAKPGPLRDPLAGIYEIPRFPYPDDVDRACLTASGFRRLIDWWRPDPLAPRP